jgi:hypothetical protein
MSWPGYARLERFKLFIFGRLQMVGTAGFAYEFQRVNVDSAGRLLTANSLQGE